MTDWPGDPPAFIANKLVTAAGNYGDDDPYAINKNIVDCIKALYDLLTGDSDFAVNAKLKVAAGLSVEFQLGDAVGGTSVIVRDSGGVQVAAIDSDGNITLSGTVDGVDLAAHVLDGDAHHVAFTAADHTAIGDGAPHHAAITLGGGSDPALSLAGQQLTLADVLTPAEHTAIGNGAPHHAAVTIGVDGEHSLVGQVLSGVDAGAAQKGHLQLAGQLGGTALLPDVRGLRETAGPTLLTLGNIADGEYLKRDGAAVVGGVGGGTGGYEPLITGGVDPCEFILADFDLIMVAMV